MPHTRQNILQHEKKILHSLNPFVAKSHGHN